MDLSPKKKTKKNKRKSSPPRSLFFSLFLSYSLALFLPLSLLTTHKTKLSLLAPFFTNFLFFPFFLSHSRTSLSVLFPFLNCPRAHLLKALSPFFAQFCQPFVSLSLPETLPTPSLILGGLFIAEGEVIRELPVKISLGAVMVHNSCSWGNEKSTGTWLAQLRLLLAGVAGACGAAGSVHVKGQNVM